MAFPCSVVIGTLVISLLLTLCLQQQPSMYTFWPNVPMSKFRHLQESVTMFNCEETPKERLRLPFDVVSQVPKFNELPGQVYYPNRTGLIHVHNMALNRAFFYSYILQHFNQSRDDFPFVPGLLYIYLSAAADVTANPGTINSSLLMYDVHNFYPNYFMSFAFNSTANLYAIRAMRIDNTFQSSNFIREPTLNLIRIYDLGAQFGLNYTLPSYRNGPWYGKGLHTPGFLPDTHDKQEVGLTYQLYIVDFKWTQQSDQKDGFSFFGPLYPGQLEKTLPVKFTQPWFDCGKMDRAFNQWASSAVSGVVDYMPRYAKDRRLQTPKFVAVAAMDTYFINIPVNLCPTSSGNPEPNLLAGSDICKPATTVCESMMQEHQVQFKRSSFRCRCRAGYRYPFPYREIPWGGHLYRRSTKREYEEFFSCIPIQNRMVMPSGLGLYERGEKDGYINVRFSRRRRDVGSIHRNTTEYENKTDSERHFLKLKQRIAFVDNVIVNHYNVSSIDEVIHKDLDYNSMKRDIRRLVSRFSPVKTPVNSRNLKPRFTSDWIATERDQKKPLPRQKILSRMKRTTFMEEVTFNDYRFQQMNDVFAKFKNINAQTCHRHTASELLMPNDVAYGVSKQFHSQASIALRLTHFLSAFLQLNRNDIVSGVRVGQQIHKQHIIAEAMANVAGDIRIVSSGVFFDRNKFEDINGDKVKYFGPLIFRDKGLASASFQMRDMANFDGGYHEREWYKVLKERWATNTYGLEIFRVEGFMRPNPDWQTEIPFPFFPMIFRAPRYEDGYWSVPYFDCTGPVPEWIITYSAPFFGRIAGKLTFMGVVTVSVELKKLDINQCDGTFFEPNFFKGTALCHKTSTFCAPVVGNGFSWGSYSCHCRAGYEFPYYGAAHFFLGTMMQSQYEKMVNKEGNIFPILKCRQTHGSLTRPSVMTVVFLLLFSLTLRN